MRIDECTSHDMYGIRVAMIAGNTARGRDALSKPYRVMIEYSRAETDSQVQDEHGSLGTGVAC